MNLDPYRIALEPYYEPLGNEIDAFKAAYAERLPVMLKGPTGCGKTRFVEHMAWLLGKPLITVGESVEGDRHIPRGQRNPLRDRN